MSDKEKLMLFFGLLLCDIGFMVALITNDVYHSILFFCLNCLLVILYFASRKKKVEEDE